MKNIILHFPKMKTVSSLKVKKNQTLEKFETISKLFFDKLKKMLLKKVKASCENFRQACV